MRNNGYPFKINNGIIRFEMDLYKYISLDDLLVDYVYNISNLGKTIIYTSYLKNFRLNS